VNKGDSGAGEDDDVDSNNASSSNEEEIIDDLTSSGERFDIIFDQKLYEAPIIIKQNCARLEAISKSQQAIKAAQTRGRW
jgi:hypothetical protein